MSLIKKRKTADGVVYGIRCYAGYDMNGKQIVKTMTWKPPAGMTARKAEKEARHQAALFEERCRTGQVLCGNIKIADFVERWMRDYAETQLRASTIAGYTHYLKRILPAIGHIRLDHLQPHHLIEFYSNLAEGGIRCDDRMTCMADLKELWKAKDYTKKKFAEVAHVGTSALDSLLRGGNVSSDNAEKIAAALNIPVDALFSPVDTEKRLSNNTIQHYHRLISSILSSAVRWQVIPYNPAERVQPPKIQRTEAPYLDEWQAMHLLELLENEPILYRTAIITLLFTGLRRGELLGLKWQDIDFVNHTITVRRSVIYTSKVGVRADDTKTSSSHRCFKAPSQMFPILKRYHTWQLTQRLQYGDQWHDEDWVFASWNGCPMRPDTLSNWFHGFISRTDLPEGVHLHSLRHTNATLLIANNVNIQTVAKRLGHSSASTTAKVYAHAIQSADAAAAEAVSVFNLRAISEK